MGETMRLRYLFALALALLAVSASLIRNVYDPAVVGDPLSSPPAERESPGGSVPATIDHV